MRTSYLFLGLIALLFCAGCGSGSSGGGVPGFIPKGNFSNASLNGQYVYQIEGFDFSSNLNGVPYREAGVFTANGSGAITSRDRRFFRRQQCLTTISTGYVQHQQ